MTKENRTPRVIGGVHFIWVSEYNESRLVGHWLSISHPSTVRVFEPRYNDPAWRVYAYKQDISQETVINAWVQAHSFCTSYFAGPENTAWQKAVEWAKHSPAASK